MRISSLLITLCLGAALGACFIESAQPSTFRFQCSTSDECNEGEVCSSGLCQLPCGPGEAACENGTVCINGFCSNLCPVGQAVCPAPQECVPVAEPDDDREVQPGICTILCDDADHPCPDGQLCLAGFCAAQCMSVDDCGSGENCTEVATGISVCIPSGSGGGSFP